MDKITLNANAKINLTLDITGRRDDGYHFVSMIMQSVDLCDVVEIERAEEISIVADSSEIPTDEKNIAFKAAKLFFENYDINGGAKIKINKNIPVCAGLAGGSTDAAAVLKGLNELYETKKSREELMELGLKIGADVPYCIMGKTALAEGIGEKLTEIAPFKDVIICLAKPNFPVSTPQAYAKIDSKPLLKHPDNEKVIEFIKNGNLKGVCGEMVNVFEEVMKGEHPEIEEIKDVMMRCGALGALMSGSGPSVYGVFENIADAKKAESILKEKMFCTVTKTV